MNRIGSLAAVAVTACLLGCGGGKARHTSQGPSAPARSVAMSLTQLRALPKSVGHAVFWEGPQGGVTYEVTRASNGNVDVRYLPAGVPVGTKSQAYPVVGSYPVSQPYALEQQGAQRKGALVLHLAGGGLAVSPAPFPHSLYVAYPQSKVLVEVYDRSPSRARRLVTSGQITPVG